MYGWQTSSGKKSIEMLDNLIGGEALDEMNE